MKERTTTYEIIKDSTGNVLAKVLITSSSKVVQSLMSSHYMQLDFDLDEAVYIPIGSYVDDELFGRFYVTEEQMPTYDTTTAGYKYTLKLNAWYYLWNIKELMLTATNIETGATFRKESVWYLTNSLKEQMREFMINLQVLGFVPTSCDFRSDDTDLDTYVDIDEDVVTKYAQALTMSYSATMMLDALKTMADTWSCEYWITGDESAFVIHFGKCEVGTEQDLSLSTNVESMSVSNSVSNYGNKLFFFGGKDNIPNTYRKELRVYAQDIATDSSTGNVASFKVKKYLTDTAYADLNADNMPSSFGIKFTGGGITTNTTYKTRGTISSGQSNIVKAFTDAYSAYASYGFEIIRTIRFRFEVDIEGYGTIDISTKDGYQEFSDYTDAHNDASTIVRIIAEEVTELYNATINDFAELRSDPIALTQTEWNKYCTNATNSKVLPRGTGETYTGEFTFGTISVTELQMSTSPTSKDDTIPSSAAYLVSSSASALSIFNSVLGVDSYLCCKMSVVDLHNDLHIANVVNLMVTLDGNEMQIESDDDVDNWYSLQDWHISNKVELVAETALTFAEWKMVADRSNGALVYQSGTTFKLADLYTLTMSSDGVRLSSGVFTYDDESVDLPEIPYSVEDAVMDFQYKFIQIIPTTESTKYKYYREKTLIATLDVSSASSSSSTDTSSNLCYETLERVSDVNHPFIHYLNCASEVVKVGVDSALAVSVAAQTLKVRVKVKAFDGIASLKVNGKYALGIMDGLSSKYSKSALYVKTLGDNTYAYSVPVTSGYYSGSVTAVTANNGYFYLDVEIPVAAGSISYDMTDFTKDSSFYGYAVLMVLNMVVTSYDADGNQLSTPTSVADDDIKTEIYQDSPVAVVVQGTGVKEFTAHMGKSGSSQDTTRIYFDTPIDASYFPEGIEILIDSDYIYKVPYVYYVSAYDDPSSVTSIGDQRLQLPHYHAEEFETYKRDGWTYESGYICCGDMAYKDGYIIAKSKIGSDDDKSIKELSVYDDEIYPDGKLLVKSVVTENKRYQEEVESETEKVVWNWQQYHLTLQRPDGTAFTFDKDYILENSDTLKIRFLVPEDIADYVDDGTISEDTYNEIKSNCRLAGMQFEVEFNASIRYQESDATAYTDHTQDYAIVRNDDFGCKLPSNVLYPAVDDPCVLVNWNVKALAALGLIAEAEYRLLEKAFEYFDALQDGNFTFTCNMMSAFMFDLYGDYISLGDSTGAEFRDVQGKYLKVKNGYDVFAIPQLGQRVKISSDALKEAQSTRVIGYEYKLDKPYDTPKLTCGESEAYSRLKQLEKEINKLS